MIFLDEMTKYLFLYYLSKWCFISSKNPEEFDPYFR